MKKLNYKINDIDVNKFDSVIELALSDEANIPLNLCVKLLDISSHVEIKAGFHVIHIMTVNWNLGNEIYRDLMEYLTTLQDEQFSYIQLNKDTQNTVIYGNNTKHKSMLLQLIEDSKQGEV